LIHRPILLCERSASADAACVQMFYLVYSTRRCQAEQVQSLQKISKIRALQGVLEAWLLIGVRYGDAIPVIDSLDLNHLLEHAQEPA
jgi:hypothetical protein